MFRAAPVVFVLRVLLSVFTLLVVAWLARALSREDLASYLVATSVVMVLIPVAQFGLRQVVMKHAPPAYGRSPYAGASVFWTTFASALALCVAFQVGFLWLLGPLVGQFLNDPAFSLHLWVIGSTICLGALRGLISDHYRTTGALATAAFVDGPSAPGINLLGLAAYSVSGAPMTLTDALLITAVSQAITVVGALLHCAVKVPDESRIALDELWQRPRQGIPFWVSSVAIALAGNMDVWLAARYLPADDTAQFALAARLAMLLTFPLIVTEAIVQPRISRLYVEGETTALQRLLCMGATLAAGLALIGTLLYVGFGAAILDVFFGSSFRSAWPILVILSTGILIRTLFGSAGSALNMIGSERIVLFLTVAFLAVRIGMSEPVLNYGGAMGLAIMSATLTVGMYGAMGIYLRRKYRVTCIAHFHQPSMMWQAFRDDFRR